MAADPLVPWPSDGRKASDAQSGQEYTWSGRSVWRTPASWFKAIDTLLRRGYAVTSHSSQGLTSERVLFNMDTKAHPELINGRFAYVCVSRASQDAQIFTNDAVTSARKPQPRCIKELGNCIRKGIRAGFKLVEGADCDAE